MMTPKQILERKLPGFIARCCDADGVAEVLMEALTAEGYAVIKSDPEDDQVARALHVIGYQLVPIGKVPEGWRIFLERLPVDSGPCWQATIRPHGEDGFASKWCDTAADALHEVVNMIAAAKDQP